MQAIEKGKDIKGEKYAEIMNINVKKSCSMDLRYVVKIRVDNIFVLENDSTKFNWILPKIASVNRQGFIVK